MKFKFNKRWLWALSLIFLIFDPWGYAAFGFVVIAYFLDRFLGGHWDPYKRQNKDEHY